MIQLFASGDQNTGVSVSASVLPVNEYSGLISFRIDWFYLLVVQGTLKSLLQHHSWKASILRHSAFFTVQLTHPYMTTGKTIALTRWTLVGKVMSLLLNMLYRCPLSPKSSQADSYECSLCQTAFSVYTYFTSHNFLFYASFLDSTLVFNIL